MPTLDRNRSKSRRRMLRVPSSYACQALADRSSLAAARACVRPAAARRAFISAGVGGKGLGIPFVHFNGFAGNGLDFANEVVQELAVTFERTLCIRLDLFGKRDENLLAPAFRPIALASESLHCAAPVSFCDSHDVSFNLGYRVRLGKFNHQSSRHYLRVAFMPSFHEAHVAVMPNGAVFFNQRHHFNIKARCVNVVGGGNRAQHFSCKFAGIQIGQHFLSFKQPSKIAGMNEVYAYNVGAASVKCGFYQLFCRCLPYDWQIFMKHGGKRQNAGRPQVPIDEKRMMVLVEQGVSRKAIAERFGVKAHVIRDRVNKLKAN